MTTSQFNATLYRQLSNIVMFIKLLVVMIIIIVIAYKETVTFVESLSIA